MYHRSSLCFHPQELSWTRHLFCSLLFCYCEFRGETILSIDAAKIDHGCNCRVIVIPQYPIIIAVICQICGGTLSFIASNPTSRCISQHHSRMISLYSWIMTKKNVTCHNLKAIGIKRRFWALNNTTARRQRLFDWKDIIIRRRASKEGEMVKCDLKIKKSIGRGGSLIKQRRRHETINQRP